VESIFPQKSDVQKLKAFPPHQTWVDTSIKVEVLVIHGQSTASCFTKMLQHKRLPGFVPFVFLPSIACIVNKSKSFPTESSFVGTIPFLYHSSLPLKLQQTKSCRRRHRPTLWDNRPRHPFPCSTRKRLAYNIKPNKSVLPFL
jgi:hypothetical protein